MTRRNASIRTFVAALVMGTIASALPGGVAGAQEVSVTRLQRDIAENSTRIDQLGREIAEATRRVGQLDADIASTEAQLETARAYSDGIRAEVRRRAATQYVVGRSRTLPLGSLADLADAAAARHYGNGVAEADQIALARLVEISESLDEATRRLQDERDEAEVQRAATVAARAQVEDLLVRQRRLLAALDVIPVMGRAQLGARPIADWFDSTGMSYRLVAGTTMRDLAQIFLEEGAAEGVRGDLAFAQAVLETGYFRWALDNNYAGLGACDSCAGEPGFPSPREGIRAQIQHLKNYADPDSTTAGLANPPSPHWYGADPAQAARNFDTFYAKGRAQTWQVMGKGNWATDPNYSAKVIGVYIRMVVFAADRG